MIHLFELRFDKRDLSHVPESERLLYFMLGEVANDLSTLSKQAMFWIQPVDGQSEIHEWARTSAAFLNVKLLAGRIYEAWNVLREEEHSRVYLTYRDDLDESALAALEQIKAYFNKKNNLVQMLRKKVAFHSDLPTMRSAYSDFPETEALSDYFSQHVGNTFFNSAHLMSAYATKQIAGSADLGSALTILADEVLNLSHLVGKYAHGFASVFATRYLEPLHVFSGPREHEIEDAPNMMAVCSPYFLAR